jgi:hypothetical protein
MGIEVAKFLAGIGNCTNFDKWIGIKKIKYLYDPEPKHFAVYNKIVFQFITHTSLNKPNLVKRYKNDIEKGKDYGWKLEIKCLKEAKEMAFKK